MGKGYVSQAGRARILQAEVSEGLGLKIAGGKRLQASEEAGSGR